MDALTVLRREHTRIGQLFVEFDALSECACGGRKALMREIDLLLRRHLEMEEALLYQRFGSCKETDHAQLLAMLDDIARTDCRTAAYIPRVHGLRDLLRRHVSQGEERLAPALAGTHAA